MRQIAPQKCRYLSPQVTGPGYVRMTRTMMCTLTGVLLQQGWGEWNEDRLCQGVDQ